MDISRKALFIFEMANNHQGSVEHGKQLICEIRKVCNDFQQFDFAFKFQYRDLDTFIHPDFQNRMDIKNVKRFQETKLTQDQFKELLAEVRSNSFLAICTPFDEISVDRIAEQKYDFIKIASCSFTDWPLLEKVAETGMPVIASGAGSTLEDIKNVVSFFGNRGIDFSLMHCVAEYPTENQQLQLNQIDLYRELFPGIRIGFSTHEDPDNLQPIRIAVAKGAGIFEKHVGLPTETIQLNSYSASPEQIKNWLYAAAETFEICGVERQRYEPTSKETMDLAALRRGVFVKTDVSYPKKIEADDVFLALPCQSGQLVASDLSKYNEIILKPDISLSANNAIMLEDVLINRTSQVIFDIIKKILDMLKQSNVVVPLGSCCEISHHYGLKNFGSTGVAMIDCVNREYCKKILVVLPKQSHPCHYHEKKEETFVILHGDLEMSLDNKVHILHKGDVMVVERGVKHSFCSETGCVFEEISTTHYVDDSFYEQKEEFVNPRKTKVHFTDEMLRKVNDKE